MFWVFAMMILGGIGLYDFYSWEYDYGHDLNPKAAIKFMDENDEPLTYQPPLIGTKEILNFKATAVPMGGTYFMFGGMILALVAYALEKKK